MSFAVWDFVADVTEQSTTGHVIATSADSDDFAATLTDENPLILYRPSVQHLKKQFEDSDFQPPVGTILVQWAKLPFPQLVLTTDVRLSNRQLLVGDLVVKASEDHQRGTVTKSATKCTIQTTTLYRHKEHGLTLPAHFRTLDAVRSESAQPLSNSHHVNRGTQTGMNGAVSNNRVHDMAVKEPQLNRTSVDGVEIAAPPAIFEDVDLYDLRTPTEYQKGDPVLYQEWAGVIRSTTEEITLRLMNNTVVVLSPEVRVSQPRAQTAYSTYQLGDMVAARKADLRLGRWLFGRYDPNVEPLGVVAKIRVLEVGIDWQSHRSRDITAITEDEMPTANIGLDEIESGDYVFYDMQAFTAHPARKGREDEFTTDPDVGALCGPRIRFRDMEQAQAKYGARPEASRLFDQSRATNLGFDMNVYEVVSSHSLVSVQWQDGTTTQETTTNLVYADFTEEDLYPGDVVCSRDVKRSDSMEFKIPKRAGVVQSVVADECISKVRWFADPTLHLDMKEDYVALPNYQLGQLSEDTEDVSIYDLAVPLGLDIGYLDNVGYLGGVDLSRTQQDSQDQDVAEVFDWPDGRDDPQGLDPHGWLGHVLENHLDATYTIRLGASRNVRNVRTHIDNISLALDPERIIQQELLDQQEGYDQHGNPLPEYSDEDMEDLPDDVDYGVIMMGDRQEAVEYVLDGISQPAGNEDDGAWSTDEDGTNPSSDRMDIEQDVAMPELNGTAPIPQVIQVPAYVLLDGDVPVGHRYFEEKSTLSNQALRKVMREHAMLNADKAMPAGIFVRSWESHCNLLRAVIIGPLETPYAQCPFVFDIMLAEDFPRKPPRFHFYHWTTGSFARNAKINPNLYEDGVVCLSLLNTWPGQEEEGWIPGQSTLLQALISIQSLILVQEPFYNEPGYEGKRDIPGTGTQSVAYNERAFLQSRGFLQHALSSVVSGSKELSLEGVEDVIKGTYLQEGGPQVLTKVIADGEMLVAKSKESDPEAIQKRDGISLLSRGACLVLGKTLDSLKALSTGQPQE
ncbi:hypothetical protein C1H76_2908 [Elsinoe australis]|uniref:UBC core domain-containing protein n=1 Tax=Elsinoe australis TaxID=40998 RepID=A0A4U7B0Z0_9PEZI|nr:hypothetical protein C1H76_2908 [Elsinoe australis]